MRFPGLTVHLVASPPAQALDRPFGGTTLYFASEAQALLENLQAGRTRSGITKTLAQAQGEEYLERIMRVRGEDGLNAVRDQARPLATALGWEAEFARLSQLSAALLNTAPQQLLTSPLAQARAGELPYALPPTARPSSASC